MYYLIGEKELFALEIDLSYDKWRNKSAIWINNIKIGQWDDENLLAPIIGALENISKAPQVYWLDELQGLNCFEIYLAIQPFLNNPDEFYDLPERDQIRLERFDRFLICFGENFDFDHLRVVCNKGICRFIWTKQERTKKKIIERSDIDCYDISHSEVVKVHAHLIEIIEQLRKENLIGW